MVDVPNVTNVDRELMLAAYGTSALLAPAGLCIVIVPEPEAWILTGSTRSETLVTRALSCGAQVRAFLRGAAIYALGGDIADLDPIERDGYLFASMGDWS